MNTDNTKQEKSETLKTEQKSETDKINVEPLSFFEKLRISLPECLLDWIWPSSRPLNEEERKKEKRRVEEVKKKMDLSLNNWSMLKKDMQQDVIEQIKARLVEEKERRNSVQNRLSTIVGMMLVVIVIILAAAGLLTSDHKISSLYTIIIYIVALYGSFQIVIGIKAAVKGLSRIGISTQTIDELVPSEKEIENYDLSKIKVMLTQIGEFEECNNNSVTQMAIAHRCLENFCTSIFIASIIFFIKK